MTIEMWFDVYNSALSFFTDKKLRWYRRFMKYLLAFAGSVVASSSTDCGRIRFGRFDYDPHDRISRRLPVERSLDRGWKSYRESGNKKEMAFAAYDVPYSSGINFINYTVISLCCTIVHSIKKLFHPSNFSIISFKTSWWVDILAPLQSILLVLLKLLVDLVICRHRMSVRG